MLIKSKVANKCLIILMTLSLFHPLFSQSSAASTQIVSTERYITDEQGNILINVNVWGHVKTPGNHLVFDGIDLATLLSIAGGPLPGAKLSKVTLFRDRKDGSGNIKYEINLDNFYKDGDRSDFVKILPNDTIVIKENFASAVFRRSNTLPLILQLLNIYIQINNNN